VAQLSGTHRAVSTTARPDGPLLKTSRTQADRLLNAKDDITLSSLQWAAAIMGRRLTIERRPAGPNASSGRIAARIAGYRASGLVL
jgi:hypothetical protein